MDRNNDFGKKCLEMTNNLFDLIDLEFQDGRIKMSKLIGQTVPSFKLIAVNVFVR